MEETKYLLIEFNKVDMQCNVFIEGCFTNLPELKVSGKIKDYEINHEGVTIIKDFDITSVSI